MTKQAWSHATFVSLFRKSPKEAFEYRERTIGVAIPSEYADKKATEPVEVEVLETTPAIEESLKSVDAALEQVEKTRKKKA